MLFTKIRVMSLTLVNLARIGLEQKSLEEYFISRIYCCEYYTHIEIDPAITKHQLLHPNPKLITQSIVGHILVIPLHTDID